MLLAVNDHDTETPMRMGPRHASDNVNIPPTSPGANVSLPATSPARGLAANVSEIDLSSPLNYGTPSSMSSIKTPRSGIRGTPLRARPDIRTDKRMRQVAIGGTVREKFHCRSFSFYCFYRFCYSWIPYMNARPKVPMIPLTLRLLRPPKW